MHLLISLLLSQFPSGSAINYRDGKLFLVGDDSNSILILTTDYQELGSIQLSNHPEKRIPKKVKPDYEAATFCVIEGQEYFMLLGSGSKANREIVRLFPVVNGIPVVAQSNTHNTTHFVENLLKAGLNEINFEGLTTFNDKLILSNRGNRSSITNHLIITTTDFWNVDTAVTILPIQLPPVEGLAPGVSELYYEPALDILFITLSSEATDNVYDDGEIGNSYLGWIKNFSTQTHKPTVALDKMICLPEINKKFKKEKIEGLCIESVTNHTLLLHLISDNDAGESRLFKVELDLSKQ